MRDVVESTYASPTSSEARSNVDHEIQYLVIVNDKKGNVGVMEQQLGK